MFSKTPFILILNKRASIKMKPPGPKLSNRLFAPDYLTFLLAFIDSIVETGLHSWPSDKSCKIVQQLYNNGFPFVYSFGLNIKRAKPYQRQVRETIGLAVWDLPAENS
jgi:hypothetical protein